MVKATFDIDNLLENIRDVDVGTIISLIDDKEVLDYIAREYDDENFLKEVILNSYTSKETIEVIAQKAIHGKFPRHIFMRLYSDKRLSDSTKRKIYILMTL